MKFSIRFLLALIVLSSFMIQVPVSTYAATCSGTGCNGKDPQSSGCASGATTVATAYFTGGYVELRWSATCQTNWARVVSTSGNKYLKAYIVQQNVGELYASNVYGQSTYSPMKYAPTGQIYIQACGFMATQPNTDVGSGNCTGFY